MSPHPHPPATEQAPAALPWWLASIFFAGAALMLAGSYWDDGWHTERGRDSFFIAPHVFLYAGVTLAAAALTMWMLMAARRQGARGALAYTPLRLALVSVFFTLASAPIDNAWHLAFGRDAVIWSPPHLLGIVGIFGLIGSVLADFARRPGLLPVSVAGGGLLTAATFAVVEYETDVPQFPAVWYLPVLAIASGLAFALVRSARPWRWAATAAAASHLVFIAVVSIFLAAMGFDPPLIPLLVVPAVALDLAARGGWAPLAQGPAYVVALWAVYIPYVRWAAPGLAVTFAQALAGLVLALAGVLIVIVAINREQRPGLHASGAVLLIVVAVAGVTASPAIAHDPGQGKDAGTLRLQAQARGMTLRASADARGLGGCSQLRPSSIVARRAGQTVRAPLTRMGCRFDGTVTLPQRGRWFVYMELRRDDQPIESWVPIVVGEGPTSVAEPERYAYQPEPSRATTTQLVSGVVMYLVALGLLGAVARLIGRSGLAT